MNKVLNFIKEKKAKVRLKTPLSETEIIITIPSVEDCKYNVSGDWGPMYQFSLKASNPIQISYKDLRNELSDIYSLEQKELVLESPMYYDERKKFPFYYIILDKRKEFRYHLFADVNGICDKVDIYRTTDNIILHTASIMAC